jgi:hypothetical protein
LAEEALADEAGAEEVLADEAFDSEVCADKAFSDDVFELSLAEEIFLELFDEAISALLIEAVAAGSLPFFAMRFLPNGDTKKSINATAAPAAIISPTISPVFDFFFGAGC